MKIVCVAEKPSIAKSVAEILSGGAASSHATRQKRNGRNRYCRNFDFVYRVNGRDAQVVVTSVLGHLMQIDFAQGLNRNWSAHPPEMLFEADMVKSVNPQHVDVQQNIEQEARHADMLVIWTDCDREGENIGSEIATVCRQVNRRIQVKRARFSVIQHREIHQAMQELGELDMRQSEAVETRSELDLRIGASFTRFITLRYTPQYVDLHDKLISYGSCQFPTLGFVVDQFLRVESFVPEEFWRIRVDVQRGDARAEFKWKRGHLFDQLCCLVLYERCVQSPMASVVSVQNRQTSKWTPLPLTTVELQKLGSRYLRIPSNVIMEIAERLYNSGLISYPRTETDQFERTFQLRPLIEAQTGNNAWGNYAQSLLDGGFRHPRFGQHNDKAHPPIHPTRGADHLAGDERRVYELITRRFLACCSDNAKGFQTTVTLNIADEEFTAKGLMIIERNFLDVYPYDRWTGNVIPVFELHEIFLPTACEMVSGSTSAPSLLSEAELITLMDKNGIGTDATIHEHIKKVLDREYVMKGPDGLFSPSTLGVALVEGFDNIGMQISLAKPFLRAEMEADMKGICEGNKTRQQVVRRSLERYRRMFRRAVVLAYLLDTSLTKYLGYPPDLSNNGYPPVRVVYLYQSVLLNALDVNRIDQDHGRGTKVRTGGTAAVAQSGNNLDGGFESGFQNQFDAPASTNNDNNRGPSPALRPSTESKYATRNNTVDASERRCQCGLLVVQRTASKGENAGRRFWTCPKESKTAKCSYFEWEDGNNSGGPQATSSAVCYRLVTLPQTARIRQEPGRPRHPL
ncbi:DNA topoisomerase [Sorochytrium milnesiophthora]